MWWRGSYRFAMQGGCTDSVCDVAHGWHGPSLYLGSLRRNKIHQLVITDLIDSNQTECLIHQVIFNRVLKVRYRPHYHTELKLNHCLQVCKQTWLHSRFIFSSILFSLSSLLLFETRCAPSFRCYRAWKIWRFCLTHRISKNQAHYRTLKGHKQQEI